MGFLIAFLILAAFLMVINAMFKSLSPVEFGIALAIVLFIYYLGKPN